MNKPKIPTTQLYTDLCAIIEQGRDVACRAVNQAAIATYWQIGRRIVEEEQQGKERAAYGGQLIPLLAEQLTLSYGNGYGRRNLAYYRKLYLSFPDLQILHACVQNLEWTHVRRVLSVVNPEARLWYLQAANEHMWSTRELDRNISTQFCERHLAAGVSPKAISTEQTKGKAQGYLKNPVVAEFLGFQQGKHFTENELEQALIDNLERFYYGTRVT